MYKVLINHKNTNHWVEQEFAHIVEALNCVKIHYHTRLIYPCNSIAEYYQGAMILLM